MPDLDEILDLIGALIVNMDNVFSVIFVLMVVFTFIDGSVRKKNKTPNLPPPIDDFNVLPLDDTQKIEVSREVKVTPPVKSRPSRNYQPIEVQPTQTVKEKEAERAELSAADAREAMILKEIFDKPKALRRR